MAANSVLLRVLLFLLALLGLFASSLSVHELTSSDQGKEEAWQVLWKSMRDFELPSSHRRVAASNCSCDMHPKVTTIGKLQVCNAPSLSIFPVVPSWLGAVVLGLFASHKLHSLGPSVTGSLSYSITFTMYAAMITSGLFVHCLFLVECGKAPVTKGYRDVGIVDAGLTSSIAISFIFNALIDLKVIPERAFGSVMTMVFTYAWIFFAYINELIPAMKLYEGSILVGCSLYLVAQLLLLLPAHQWKGLLFLLAAGGVGGAGMFALFKEQCWLCTTLGPWSIEGVWYYSSDLAMLFVFLSVWITRQRPHSHACTPVLDTSLQKHGQDLTMHSRIQHL